MNKRFFLSPVCLLLPLAFLSLAGCRTAAQGWHRPAKPGERVGQVIEVKGANVTISVDESCLVHPGDVLQVKRMYFKPNSGRKNEKKGPLFDSGTVISTKVNVEDHTVLAALREGTVEVDSPVYMTGESTEHGTNP